MDTERVGRICRLTLMQVAPAVLTGDIRTFGAAITEIQEVVGEYFAPYQGGVYHEALKTFARTVCGLPEVRCTSYERLADALDRLAPETLAAYRNGEFPRAKLPPLRVVELSP